MKIESYSVGMSSTSVSSKSTVMGQRITGGPVKVALIPASALLAAPRGGNGTDILSLSPEAQGQQNRLNQSNQQNRPKQSNQQNRGAEEAIKQEMQERQNRQNARNRPEISAMSAPRALSQSAFELSDKDRLKLTLLERMIEALTGKKYRFGFSETAPAKGQGGPDFSRLMQAASPVQSANAGSGIRLETFVEYSESQQMSFQATGLVNTSDGRQIRFDMNVLASYEFTASMTSSVAIQGAAVNLCDPLIINFNGTLPEFTKDRYEFDLTIDGKLDNIFMPTNGSGLLALDKNGDGTINDGSELFGAKSGNGFADLAAYDEDGNGWIDEGDSVFEQLKLMFVDKATGEIMQVSLKDSGVGAIFLGSVAADFEIKTAGNETVGQVRRNGIFLNENGTAGTIHHIDLTY